MPLGIDFSTIVHETVTFISRKSKVYDLRDDTPMELILIGASAVAQAMNLSQINPQVATAVEARAQFDTASNALTSALGNVIRYSLPDVTDDDVRDQFPFEDRVGILSFFSSLIGKRYALPPPNTSELATTTTTPNEATSTSTSTSS